MTLLSIEHIVGSDNYFIDDKTLQIWSFKGKNKNGKLMKGHYTKYGYLRYTFRVNGKHKNIFYHVIIVKMFINPNFDSTKEEIDHRDHNRTNNSIENLAIVSRLENNRNKSISRTGKPFNFVGNIGKSLVINDEAQIYYSLELDKFFMYINHTNKYKELHEFLQRGYPYIQYSYNNKNHKFSVNKFKKSLNKK